MQKPADMYCGDRTAGVRDVSGNTWHRAQEGLTPEELAAQLKAVGKHLPEVQSAR